MFLINAPNNIKKLLHAKIKLFKNTFILQLLLILLILHKQHNIKILLILHNQHNIKILLTLHNQHNIKILLILLKQHKSKPKLQKQHKNLLLHLIIQKIFLRKILIIYQQINLLILK